MYQIGVIGSGSIGPDLAYGFISALAGREAKVFLHDIAPAQLEQGQKRIEGYLKKALERGKMSSSAVERARAMLVPTLNLIDLAGCSYVLEAASEVLEVKRRILASLEQVVTEQCLIGFATSGLPRAWIARDAKHPHRCFVNHPFYPAWRSLPMELVASDEPQASNRMFQLLIELGKVPVVTADTPCFAADDVFCNLECEAFRMLEEGLGSPAQIDATVDAALGGGGPFRVADMTRGNPLIAHCQDLLAEHYGLSWFKPPRILVERGDRPWYGADGEFPDREISPVTRQTMEDRVLAVVFARSFDLIDKGICQAGDLDWLLRNSLGFRRGPLRQALEMGMADVARLCASYRKVFPEFPVPESIEAAQVPEFLSQLQVSGPDDQGIVEVLVRRPEVLNALNAATIGELEATFARLEADAAVRGILFGGFGGALAGADINELAALDSAEQCVAVAARGQALTRQMEKLSKPLVAVLDGPVLGGGCELAMAAWARVVGPKTVIGQPEVNLGIIPGYGGTQRLPRLIGMQRALAILSQGGTFKSNQALEWGWAQALDPSGHPRETARRLLLAHLNGERHLQPVQEEPLDFESLPVVDIGHRSLACDRILREVLAHGLRLRLDEGLALEALGFGRCYRTQDMAIGMANFKNNGPRVPAVFLNR
jgi:enoyl-CoA hydratase/3-hydroxyacyl-CoA dehydrogenase